MGGSKATFKGNKEVGLPGFPDQGNQQPGPKPFGGGEPVVSKIIKGVSEIGRDRDTPPIFRGDSDRGGLGRRRASKKAAMERNRYRERRENEMEMRRERDRREAERRSNRRPGRRPGFGRIDLPERERPGIPDWLRGGRPPRDKPVRRWPPKELVDPPRGDRPPRPVPPREGRFPNKPPVEAWIGKKPEIDYKNLTPEQIAKLRNPHGFTHPGGISTMALVDWYNPETGETWTANKGGYRPPEGSAWQRGRGPSSDTSNTPKVGYSESRPPKGVDSSKFKSFLSKLKEIRGRK